MTVILIKHSYKLVFNLKVSSGIKIYKPYCCGGTKLLVGLSTSGKIIKLRSFLENKVSNTPYKQQQLDKIAEDSWTSYNLESITNNYLEELNVKHIFISIINLINENLVIIKNIIINKIKTIF